MELCADGSRHRPLVRLLHGNELLGHPPHPVVIALPVGAWRDRLA